MDSNGNGQIDMDEMQGPARFMLDRMAQNNPKIDLSKPVPLSVLTEGMDQMRKQRDESGGRGDEDRGDEDGAGSETESLVPTFGVAAMAEPPLGFGKDGELFSIKVLEVDTREAAERLKRYDRNNDGAVDQEELKRGRWTDNPMQYDRNRDGKLQANELAVRYARKRISDGENKTSDPKADQNNSRQNRWGGQQQSPEPEVPKGLWDERASYRVASNTSDSKVQGVPDWFNRDDADGDGQIAMREFTSDWTMALVEEFDRFDSNGDGFITAREALQSVKAGIFRGAPAAKIASSDSKPTASDSGSSGEMSLKGLPEDAEERWVKFAVTKLKKADADRNGRITGDEWGASDGPFSEIDQDGDGQITVAEYYAHRKKK